MKGFDIAEPVGRAHIHELQALGYGFVAGYMSYNVGKNLTADECRALSEAGIAIVTVFEAQGNLYRAFGSTNGWNDAAQALKCAGEIGQPLGSAIYFAVDFDASPGQIAIGITAYFRSVRASLAGKYRVGVYGSGAVLAAMQRDNLAEMFWLADAGGWSGTRGYAGAVHIKQGLPTRVAGLSVDPDDAADGDFGQWMVADVKPQPASPALDLTDPVALIRQAQVLIGAEPDGVVGPETMRLLREWRAAHPET